MSLLYHGYSTMPRMQSFTPQQHFTAASEAVLPSGNGMLSFGVVSVNIHYPSYNIVDEAELAIRAAIAHNHDEPLYFVCDMSQTSLDLASLDLASYTMPP